MARRKKTSPVEDVIAIVAMLPWWAGCTLALLSYFLLHSIATQPFTAAVTPGQVGVMMTQTLWHAFAMVGQYFLPVICLIGAAISAFKRRQRQSLLSNVANSTAADALHGISWQEFEMLVGEAFRLRGYQVTENGGGGADGGVDLVLRKDGEKFLVQCKQWKAFTVGVTVVRELYGVMASSGAAGGFVVTSGRFTDEATKFAEGRNVTLMDGPGLLGLINQAQASQIRRVEKTNAQARVEPTVATTPARTAPLCPKCSKVMVKRIAKQGANAGSSFWGCVDYPTCRGVRQIG